ncbi:DUF2460 domain-containing protein [Rhodoplanes elegans]|uniref:DUF2460 domain-containing protein n=1 Tax=Rhodoplanes elegans TaxID=29408 RepID=UPI001FDF1615|nr:DUF2460 domain-containing protein [Rhodoplanes elegans]
MAERHCRATQWKYRIELKVVADADAEAAVLRFSLFRARKGRAYGFRFRDWNDFEAAGEPLGATAEPLVWQLFKQYVSGSSAEQRVITKPVAGSVVVRIGGTPVAVTVNHLNGKVTFAAAPGAQPYADFQFDVAVRFDTDHLPVVAVDYHIHQVSSIVVVEIRA